MRRPRHKLLVVITCPLLAVLLAAVVFGVVIGCGGHGGDVHRPPRSSASVQ